jgi:hypothetical protein
LLTWDVAVALVPASVVLPMVLCEEESALELELVVEKGAVVVVTDAASGMVAVGVIDVAVEDTAGTKH